MKEYATAMNKPIRHFDFERELIITLTDPDVAAAYQVWSDFNARLNTQSSFAISADDRQKAERLYNALLKVAREKHALEALT